MGRSLQYADLMPEKRSQRNDFAARLLAWYDVNARSLPWRTPPGVSAAPDPYRVWLSEIMLQQTTVEVVKPYFASFLARWPDVEALAAAPFEDVLKAWAGLGYYSRARNLKAAADSVMRDHGGCFPANAKALKSLPGVGDYTANAIAAIAFGQGEPVVDGNVERVIARHRALPEPVSAIKKEIRRIVSALVPAGRPGDFAQAMMDLGATICAPKRAACLVCPVAADCAGRGNPLAYPARPAKAAKPVRRGAAFVAVNGEGAVLLRKRPENGLLASMAEPPVSAFSARADGATNVSAAPFGARWRACGEIDHVFTHFALRLAIYRADVGAMAAPDGHWWAARRDLDREALPSVMKKAIAAAFANRNDDA